MNDGLVLLKVTFFLKFVDDWAPPFGLPNGCLLGVNLKGAVDLVGLIWIDACSSFKSRSGKTNESFYNWSVAVRALWKTLVWLL